MDLGWDCGLKMILGDPSPLFYREANRTPRRKRGIATKDRGPTKVGGKILEIPEFLEPLKKSGKPTTSGEVQPK